MVKESDFPPKQSAQTTLPNLVCASVYINIERVTVFLTFLSLARVCVCVIASS